MRVPTLSVLKPSLKSSLIVAVAATCAVSACKKGGGGGIVDTDFGLDDRPQNDTCLAPARPQTGVAVGLAPAFDNLTFSVPIGLFQAPGSDRWYVMQQDGTVRTFANDPNVAAATTFIDATGPVTYAANSEYGLLGMAFHPSFATNGLFYLSYTGPGTGGSGCGNSVLTSRISRFSSADGGLTASIGTESIRFSLAQPFFNHNGGNIAFGPDGFLYAGFGDGGSGGDPCETGQDVTDLLGKILRLDITQGTTYGIPPTNPFAVTGGRPEIYAWGFRNPWRFSFDQATGQLWAGDVGQDAIEEIDLVELGGNYGWDDKEGTNCFEDLAPCDGGGRIDPVVQYDHSLGASVTGGFVYRGTAIPELIGSFIYGDFESGAIWAVVTDPATGAAGAQVLVDVGSGLNIGSFGQGADGEVYVLDYFAGKIKKLVPTSTPPPDTFPQTLSATGCVNPNDATQPASGLIPYDVNAPLWSDGATKKRWMALPDGERITIGTDGDWDLPTGSVLVKEFSGGGRRLETRLLVRHDDGNWAGYTYEWNDAQTDATLLPAGKTAVLGAVEWTFPSRGECLACHTNAAGRSLGLETAQLNRDYVYPGGRNAPQLATLQHIDVLANALPSSPPKLPDPDGSLPADMRARSYLHANCGNCHRPGSSGQGDLDLLYETPEMSMNICNVDPQEGDLGVAGAKLLVPGDPSLSLMSLRMYATDSNRMPDVGTKIVDTVGTTVVDEWITSITACP